jgi:serine/threonine-protein kinase
MPVTLGPRYRALSLLAKGGMGAVYLGRRFSPDEPLPLVAIKVMHPHIAESAETIKLFIDEAVIGTRIDHPNVVRVLDADVVEGTPFIVMDYVEGLSWSRLLRRLLERGEPAAVDVAARVVHDALVGLEAAHRVGAIHRDVSPQNILVGTDGRARIADFGVATFSGRLSLTTPGHLRGKLGYLSPEQIVRSPLDPRADVFAAGIVLWEALAGRPLFATSSEPATLANVLREPIAPPSSFAPDVPMALEDACLKALERTRERRFATAQAFADAIAAAVPLASPERVAAEVERLGGEVLEDQRAAHAAALEALRAPAAEERPRPVVRPSEVPTAIIARPRASGRRGRVAITAAGAIALVALGSILGRASSPDARGARPPATAAAGPPSAAPEPATPITVARSEPPVVAAAAEPGAALPAAASIVASTPRPHARRSGPRAHPSAPAAAPSAPAPGARPREDGVFVPPEL